MAKVSVSYADYFVQTIQRMDEEGLVLQLRTVPKADAMTIGWEAIGSIW